MTKHSTKKVQQEMEYHILGWLESGQSQQDYCQKHNVPLYQLQYWQHILKISKDAAQGLFVQVDTQPLAGEATSTEVEVTFPNGVRLKVVNADTRFISELIQLA
jgi:hypothetical protein